MIRNFRYVTRHFPLTLVIQVSILAISILIVSVVAFLWFEVPLNELHKPTIATAAGGLLGYVVAHIFALDRAILENMSHDSKQATVLLLEYFTYCKTGDPKPLGSLIRTILAKRELPPKLLLELYCYRQRLTPPPQLSNPAAAPQTGLGIIPFPHELLADLESISGIKCKDWLKVCAF